jgi:thermitase
MYGLYLSDSGTSLASSMVAGVAALMFSANPTLTPADVRHLLETTAFHPGGIGRDQHYGFGRIDAFAAVSAAAAYQPTKVGSGIASVQ